MDWLQNGPYITEDVPFDGSGPSMSEGAAPSERQWGQMGMITGQVSVFPLECPGLPYAQRVIEWADVPLYPEATSDATGVLLAPSMISPLHYPSQDFVVGLPFGDAYTDLPLGAPAIPNGNAAFIGRS